MRRKRIRVQIVQPVIPAYRVALFTALASRDELELRVCASQSVPSAPATVETGAEYEDLNHRCFRMLGQRLLWQRHMKLDPGMGPGDVLVIGGIPRFLSNIPLLWQARRRGIGIVWWQHGFSKGRRAWRERLRRLPIRSADTILLYTSAEVEEYKRLGFSAERLFAANNTIDTATVRNAARSWSPQALLSFQQRECMVGKHILLFCGRVTRRARLQLGLVALRELMERNRAYVLVVVGDGREKAALVQQSAKLGVQGHVRWLGAMYEESSLSPWFLSACCSVYPGSVGLGLLHALAYGLPVITHDNLSFQGPEVAALRDRENGLFFREGDAHDLAEKIQTVAENQEYQARLSAEALQTVETDFSMENMVRRFAQAIHVASRRSFERHDGSASGEERAP